MGKAVSELLLSLSNQNGQCEAMNEAAGEAADKEAGKVVGLYSQRHHVISVVLCYMCEKIKDFIHFVFSKVCFTWFDTWFNNISLEYCKIHGT